MKTKVLLTGCTGLVGHGICLSLLKKGYEVWGTSRNKLVSKNHLFHPIIFDLKSTSSLENLSDTLSKIDILIHNAALIPSNKEHSFEEYLEVNFLASHRLFEKSIKSGVKKIIYISGSPMSFQKVINNSISESNEYSPKNDYGNSKALTEILCRNLMNKKLNTTICVFRFTAPYGYINNSSAVFPRFLKKAIENKTITLWGKGMREQTFTFVEDIGEACHQAISKNSIGIYTLTGPDRVTMIDLAKKIIMIVPNCKSKIIFENKIDPQEGLSIEISLNLIKKELNFFPRFNLEKGINKILEFENSQNFYEKVT